MKTTLRLPLLVILLAGAIVIGFTVLLAAAAGWAWQATPAYQFGEARARWENRPFFHYRMTANYATNWSQCYYDIEVRRQRVVQVFGLTCLSSAQSNTLTIDGIFQSFERFVEQRVCSPNGCYCEGDYVVRAMYDPTWGYPQRITTEFHRNRLDDMLHGKLGALECLRTTPAVEKIEVVAVTPLP